MKNIHTCKSESCSRYGISTPTEHKAGDRVVHKQSGKVGTIQTVPCPSCEVPMKLDVVLS